MITLRDLLVCLQLTALLAAGCAEDSFSGQDSAVTAGDVGLDWGAQPDYLAPVPVIVQGKVLAPNGSMPISGALVYAVNKEPAPIPDQVYCDTCVELPKTTPNARSAADGSFKLKLPFKGDWIIVTQKGAFRRARKVTVPEQGLTLPDKTTTLPGKTDKAAGDFIPKMAVVEGAWDAIEKSLGKLGLAQVDSKGSVVAGSEAFTRYKCTLVSILPPKLDCKPKAPADLLKDYNELAKYHIIYLPCDSDWLDYLFADKTVQANLKKWIQAGGRLYVTDYQYDALNLILPGYITWVGASGVTGSAELTSPYDGLAVVNDADLKAWLAAQGITTFQLLESYTIIDQVTKLPTPGPDSKPYDVLPQAWISVVTPSNGIKPATVSYPYGCGRILFSTYHTEGDKSSGTSLLPQERALLYVLLEVAVCLKDPTVE